MSIQPNDLAFYASQNDNSVGGAISVDLITTQVLNNLFDRVSQYESSNSLTDYRKIFIKNNHPTDTLENVRFWRVIDTGSAWDEILLGVGSNDDDDGSSELDSLDANGVIGVAGSGVDTREVTLVGEDASGKRQAETITLTGGGVIDIGVLTFSKLYTAYVTAISENSTVSIYRGNQLQELGEIAVNKKSAILFLEPESKANGIKLPDLAPSETYPLWLKRIVTAPATEQYSNTFGIRCEGDL